MNDDVKADELPNEGQSELNADRVRALFAYDPETGVFTHKVRNSLRVHIGDVAGSWVRGYRRLRVDGQDHYAHRIAWLYMHGAWPTGQIDHIDGNRANNAIANLRDVRHAVNQQNQRKAQKGSKTGLLGVTKASGKGYRAVILVDGKQKHLGKFELPQQAHEAYLAAKRAYHEGCTL